MKYTFNSNFIYTNIIKKGFRYFEGLIDLGIYIK